jgi:TRAP-type C4-dicarboxylate transport system permease small subunit
MKLEKIVDTGIPIFGGILLLLMVSLTFLQIVLREFFEFSLNWSDEVAQFCMSWLALFGSIWVTKNSHHLNTGIKLHQKLNKKIVCLIDGILDLLIASIALVVSYQTALFAFSTMVIDSLSVPWLKMGYIFIALPIFMLAVIYYYIKSFFEKMIGIFRKD